MVTRTNFLWVGDLVSQVVVTVASIAAFIVVIPYFFAAVGKAPTVDTGLYRFFGLIVLINIGYTIWRWQRTQRWMDAVRMHPEKWLAHWHYDQRAWQTYAESERSQAYWSLAKWSLPVLLLGALITYGWLQILGLSIFGPLLVVIVINLAIVLLEVGVLPYYRVLQTTPQALITEESVWIGGTVYFWRHDNSSLRAVRLIQGQPNTLEFKLQVHTGRYPSFPSVRVPVPPGYEQQAQQVVDLLTN